jgi:hypothetical protein
VPKCNLGTRAKFFSFVIEVNMRALIAVALVFVASFAIAADLEDLAREGYAVVEETRVDGEFEGCDFDKRIPFTNGLVFVCSSYNYSYSYRPEVLILQHVRNGDIKVLINGRDYLTCPPKTGPDVKLE